jgi:hypothetical protein
MLMNCQIRHVFEFDCVYGKNANELSNIACQWIFTVSMVRDVNEGSKIACLWILTVSMVGNANELSNIACP